MSLYDLYGLLIDSEIALKAHAANADRAPDLAITVGDRRQIPDVAPGGDLVAHARWGDKGYATARSTTGLVFRFFRACDIEISPDLTRAVVHLAPGVDAGLASTLISGTVLALILALRGECVLHASAAVIRGQALAFVGETGSGKSTLAALACVRGAVLLTDDVLCLDLSTQQARCRRGPREIRLRENAAELLERMRDSPTSRTADERWSIEPKSDLEAEPPLAALFFPEPSREVVAPVMNPLSPRECLLRLLRAPRLGGLRDFKALATQFAHFAETARRIPAYTAIVPWGPPFDERVLDTLLEVRVLLPRAARAAVAT